MNDNDRLMRARQLSSSGFPALCGIEIEEVRTGYCKAYCDLQESHMNSYGIVHGGVAATLMDAAASLAAANVADPPKTPVTRSADMHFIRPVHGNRMTAKAQAVKVGAKTGLIKADVFDEENRLAASAFFEMFYLDKP